MYGWVYLQGGSEKANIIFSQPLKLIHQVCEGSDGVIFKA